MSLEYRFTGSNSATLTGVQTINLCRRSLLFGRVYSLSYIPIFCHKYSKKYTILKDENCNVDFCRFNLIIDKDFVKSVIRNKKRG